MIRIITTKRLRELESCEIKLSVLQDRTSTLFHRLWEFPWITPVRMYLQGKHGIEETRRMIDSLCPAVETKKIGVGYGNQS